MTDVTLPPKVVFVVNEAGFASIEATACSESGLSTAGHRHVVEHPLAQRGDGMFDR